MFTNLIECASERPKSRVLPLFCFTMAIWLLLMTCSIAKSIYQIFTEDPKLDQPIWLCPLADLPLPPMPGPNPYSGIARPHIVWRSTCQVHSNLYARIKPEYPACAKQAGIEGDVVIRIFIDKNGNVIKAVVKSGPPALRKAALDAVKEWRFEPNQVDGGEKRFAGQVIFRFRLSPIKKID